ncbi:MAG: universal stress protein [Bacillota bacterium]|jgi:nucleotide-binding universal stress UspA family protein
MKILVAIDGSEQSLKAADVAVKMTQAFDAEITLITVVFQEPIYNMAAMPGALMKNIFDTQAELTEREKEHGKMLLEYVTEKFIAVNIQPKHVISVGFPSEEIIKEADRGEYDMLIMGCRGLASLTKRVFMGSVTERVIHHTKANVLVVK